MKRTRVLYALLALSLSAVGASHSPAGSPPPRAGGAVDTSCVLAPGDSGYADAVAFGHLLEGRGFRIQLIARSKLSGFLGEWRSASYRTDHGNFAVVFFPAPDGAERVRITSEVVRGHYLYTYRTHQPGLRREQREGYDGPQRFVVHGRWFILVWDGNTEQALKYALAGS